MVWAEARRPRPTGVNVGASAAADGSSAEAGRAAGAGTGAGAGRWLVLLDAAKACATAPPDLSAHPADFVALSYYKIFGHPTGLGALVVRRSSLELLAAGRRYFGGGTVEAALPGRDFFARRPGPAGLEEGTPAFTSVAAARHGFDFLERLGGLPAVCRHTSALAGWLARALLGLRHGDGSAACVVYGWAGLQAGCGGGGGGKGTSGSSSGRRQAEAGQATLREGDEREEQEQGPTVTFNLLRPDGSFVGYHEVSRLAAMHGVHLRTGCFCNPGACAAHLSISPEDMLRHYREGHVCWDDHDLMGGQPTGAVRASLGHVSSFEDCYALVALLSRYFLAPAAPPLSDAPHAAATAAAAAVPAAAWAAPGEAAEAPGPQVLAAAPGRPRPRPRSSNGSSSSGAVRPATDQGDGVAATTQAVMATASSRPSAPAGKDDDDNAGGGGSAAPLVLSSLPPAQRLGTPPPPSGLPPGAGWLSAILLYPIKSCAPQKAACWPVGPNGLLFDREWALVDDNGKVLTLKQCPRMATIVPLVDLARGTLTITPPPPPPPSSPSQQQEQQQQRPLPPLVLSIAVAVGQTAADGAGGGPQPASNCSGKGPAAAAGVCGGKAQAGGADGSRSGEAVKLDAGLYTERVQVCGDSVCSALVGVGAHGSGGDGASGEAAVRAWFARVLGVPCRIVQQKQGSRAVKRPPSSASLPAPPAAAPAPRAPPPHHHQQHQQAAPGPAPPEAVAASASPGPGPAAPAAAPAATAPGVGFANDGQYLVVSEASLADLEARLEGSGRDARAAELARFRPNLVVAGLPPYHEDGWGAVQVGGLRCEVLGSCPRCELLQVDPRLGARGNADVMVALAQYRRRGGRLHFGVLLAAAAGQQGAGAGPAADGAPHERAAGAASASSGPGGGGPETGCSSSASASAWPSERYPLVLSVGDAVMPSATEHR